MNKTYMIVGASSGIGLHLTRTLIDQGHEVIALSRTLGELPSHERLQHHTYDVSNPQTPDLDLSRLDGLVYCPGSINLKPFHRLKRADFQADLDINLLGAVEVLQWALPWLKKAGSASVVLFSTVAVAQGMGFHSSIAAAKGAIEGLTRSLAAEWAPKIRVNCIAPSIVDTPLAGKLLSTPEKVEASAKRHPLGTVGAPDVIAYLASFLLSDDSKWTTGQILHADGGMSSIKMM